MSIIEKLRSMLGGDTGDGRNTSSGEFRSLLGVRRTRFTTEVWTDRGSTLSLDGHVTLPGQVTRAGASPLLERLRSRASPGQGVMPSDRRPTEGIVRLLKEAIFERLREVRVDTGTLRGDLAVLVQNTIETVLSELGTKLPDSVLRRVAEESLDGLLGFGPIQKLLDMDNVTEVMVNGPGQVYAEVRGKLRKTTVTFRDGEQVRQIIERILIPLARRCDETSPCCDARLPDGSRVNIIIPPLSRSGPCLTIRKFSPTPIRLQDLVERGTVTQGACDFLAACVRLKLNIVVSGGTGSGKTTTLNAISEAIPECRLITIEDAAELRLQQRHVVTLEARPPNTEGQGHVTIRELLKNALHMRPDRIIVGECRGGEALDMITAMSSGNKGSLSTGHANTPEDLLRRLETMVLMLTALTVDVGYLYYQQARLQMITDMAALAGLGTTSTNQTVAAQQTGIDNTIRTVFNVNYGGAPDRPSFSTTFTVTRTSLLVNQEVDSVTLTTTQNVSTTFWKILGKHSVDIAGRTRIERTYAPIGFFSRGNFTVTGTAGRFDSYHSGLGNYNPANTPAPASPNLGGTFDRGNLVVASNGTFTFANQPYNFFGDLRSVGNATIRATAYVRGDTRSRGTLNPAPDNLRVTGLEVPGDRSFIAVANVPVPVLPLGTAVGPYDNDNITRTGAITAAQLTAAQNGDLNSAAAGTFRLQAGSDYLCNRFRATSNTTRVVILSSTTSANPTRIYFRGTLNNAMVVQGGLSQNVSTENAGDIQILGTNTAGSIALTCRTFGAGPATADTFAQIYAPNLNVTVAMDTTAGTQFLGSIVGNAVALDTPAAVAQARQQSWVYDEALGGALGIKSEGAGARIHLSE